MDSPLQVDSACYKGVIHLSFLDYVAKHPCEQLARVYIDHLGKWNMSLQWCFLPVLRLDPAFWCLVLIWVPNNPVINIISKFWSHPFFLSQWVPGRASRMSAPDKRQGEKPLQTLQCQQLMVTHSVDVPSEKVNYGIFHSSMKKYIHLHTCTYVKSLYNRVSQIMWFNSKIHRG